MIERGMVERGKIGEIRSPDVRGAIRILQELCDAFEAEGLVCDGDRTRSIAVSMKNIKEIQPQGYDKPIMIKQWLNITNEALLGHKASDRVMNIEVTWSDNGPFRGGYEPFSMKDLNEKDQRELRTEVKTFIEKRLAGRKIPKFAQSQLVI